MKQLLVFALALAALAAAPVDLVDTADACQPYEVYCPLTGQYYRGCGYMGTDAPIFQCARDVQLPP